MANEITTQVQLKLVSGDLTDTYNSPTLRLDQTVAKVMRNTQEVGTTEEALSTGDITTPGLAVFVNLDATNYIEVGSYVGAVFYPFMKLKPGEQQLVRIGISAATLYAKADTLSCDLFYIIYND